MATPVPGGVQMVQRTTCDPGGQRSGQRRSHHGLVGRAQTGAAECAVGVMPWRVESGGGGTHGDRPGVSRSDPCLRLGIEAAEQVIEVGTKRVCRECGEPVDRSGRVVGANRVDQVCFGDAVVNSLCLRRGFGMGRVRRPVDNNRSSLFQGSKRAFGTARHTMSCGRPGGHPRDVVGAIYFWGTSAPTVPVGVTRYLAPPCRVPRARWCPFGHVTWMPLR